MNSFRVVFRNTIIFRNNGEFQCCIEAVNGLNDDVKNTHASSECGRTQMKLHREEIREIAVSKLKNLQTNKELVAKSCRR